MGYEMGCIASSLLEFFDNSGNIINGNIKTRYKKYYSSNCKYKMIPRKSTLHGLDVNINYLRKGKNANEKYLDEETEEQKYGDLEQTAWCGLYPRNKDPLSDPRKKEGKLKGVWIDGQYVNTELKMIIEEQRCCKCKSLAQIRREKRDYRDNAYAEYLQKAEESKNVEKKN